MSIEAMQIKQRMGNVARDRIVSDLGLKKKGDHVCCPYPAHNENTPSAHWHAEAFQFHCFGCGNTYDIFNHFEYHHGMNFFEALQALGKETGVTINSSHVPLLTKKTKVENSPRFSSTISKRPLSEDTAQDYLKNKKIDLNVFKDNYGGQCSEKEIFFSHYELVAGAKTEVFCKRRKLDGSFHKNHEGEEMGKEIAIAGGTSCFYGLGNIIDGLNPTMCIITEGHTDALRVATELHFNDMLSDFVVLSLPNGARSLKVAIENSPSFNKYQRKFEKIIVIPDADDAGQGFVSDCAKYLDHSRTTWIDITKLNFKMQKTKGNDITDALNAGVDIMQALSASRDLPSEFCKSAKDVKRSKLSIGFSSGFKTFDYSEAGIKDGYITLLTGFRGQGKTTFARQILLASAKQGIKSVAWFGESDIEEESDIFAQIYADGNNVDLVDNGHGLGVYLPSDDAVNQFKDEVGEKILFYVKPIDFQGRVFDHMMTALREQAKKGAKLFLIDNLMVLTSGAGASVFNEQETIIAELKKFAVHFKVHVVLVAHPKKGDGLQSISGSASIENTADSIYRYVRVNESSAKPYTQSIEAFPQAELMNVSAILLNEKVRGKGVENTLFLEWVPERGCVREICYIPETLEDAKRYEEVGYFSRPGRYCEDMNGQNVNGL